MPPSPPFTTETALNENKNEKSNNKTACNKQHEDESSHTIAARIIKLTELLRCRNDQYAIESKTKSTPSKEVIANDVNWLAEYDELKILERQAAGNPRLGCCNYYVKRKRRFCVSRVRDGFTTTTMCTLHRMFDPMIMNKVGCDDGNDDDDDNNDGETKDNGSTKSLRDVILDREACRRNIVEVVVETETTATQTTTEINKDGNKRKYIQKTNVNRRMKKMTNPLAAQFQTPKSCDEEYWKRVYGYHHDDTKTFRPLLVDIGTAKGGFIKALANPNECANECTVAKNGTNYNLLGIEIFDILVTAANEWVEGNKAILTRKAHFISCNVNVSLKSLCLPNVQAICIQFPDPWSSAKHVNRRVMTPDFVQLLAQVLPVGGELFVCSDIKPLAEEMYDLVIHCFSNVFELDRNTYDRVGEKIHATTIDDVDDIPEYDAAHKFDWGKNPALLIPKHNSESLSCAEEPSRRWLNANPYASYTERDIVCEGKWRPVYRFAAIRKK